jgi:hypothetical protein
MSIAIPNVKHHEVVTATATIPFDFLGGRSKVC